MKFVLVYNPRSGSSMPLDDLKKEFKSAGHEIIESIPVQSDLQVRLDAYLDQKDIAVAAYGGDGTISSVAAVLLNKNTIFLPLAGGTLNHFTKDLNIPQELDAALARINSLKIRKIDVASVNGKIFINNSSIGFYPATLSIRKDIEQRLQLKWTTAIIANFMAFLRYRTFTVDIDGELFKTPFIFIGNNDYNLENDIVNNRNKINEHLLSIYAAASTSRFAMLKIFLLSLVHKSKGSPELKIWKRNEITISTRRKRVSISRDGEHDRVNSPLHYEIIPGALSIFDISE